MSYLSNISRFTGQNMGGLLEILVIRKADVESIPDPVDGVIYGQPTLKAGKSFVKWEVTKGSAQFFSQDQDTQEGISRKNSVPFFVAKDSPIIRQMFKLAENDEHIIIVQDSNGVTKIFGDIGSPVRFSYRHDTSPNAAGRNGFTCEFSFEGPDNVFYYEADIPEPPAGPLLAVVTVNGVTIASLLPGETIAFTTDYEFDHQIIGAQ